MITLTYQPAQEACQKCQSGKLKLAMANGCLVSRPRVSAAWLFTQPWYVLYGVVQNEKKCNILHFYLRQGGYVFASVSLSVCLSVCHQDYAKSY